MSDQPISKTTEEQEHFSPDRNHWCIVKYAGTIPLYYAGYYARYNGQKESLPAFTSDFDQSLKLHSKIAAEVLFNNLKRHSADNFNDCKVEDHSWM